MMIPIDLLTPIHDDLLKFGRAGLPVRPWLGLYSTEVEDKLVVVGVAAKARPRAQKSRPANRARGQRRKV